MELNFKDLKEGKKYLHSVLGVVTLCEKPNICVSDKWNNFHIVKLIELTLIK